MPRPNSSGPPLSSMYRLGPAPQLVRGEARALPQCRQLGPDNAWTDLAGRRKAGKAAIGTGEPALPTEGAVPESSNGAVSKMPSLRGTEGSNPVPSTGESAANRTSS